MAASKNSLMVHVAELYYLKNMTQQEIAKEVGISRPTVCRLLDEARLQKIVEIKLNIGEEIHVALSNELRSRLSLDEVIVVAGEAASSDPMPRTAHAAAEHLSRILRENMVLGVSWGAILKETANYMPSMELPSMKVVQIVGGLAGPETVFDGSEVSHIFASKLNATCHPVLAPAILPTQKTAAQFQALPAISQTLTLAMEADIYITGVGTLRHGYQSSLQRAGYIGPAAKKQLIQAGGIAHLAGQIILADGSELESFNCRTVAIPLRKLREGNTICVTCSADKAEAVLAAVRGRYFKTLIIDEACAKEMVRLLDSGAAL